MKKTIVLVVAAFFLDLSPLGAQTAQSAPGKRTHTRPPYSGLSNSGHKLKKHSRPARSASQQGKGTIGHEKPKFDHIVVR